jgi:hypothetical protein
LPDDGSIEMTKIEENILAGTLKINVKEGPLMQLSAQERKEDMLQLYELLSENYPYFSLKKKKYNYDWLAHKEDFIYWAENCSCNEDFYLAIKKVVTLLQNNHTELMNPMYRVYLSDVYEGDNCWYKVLNHSAVVEKYKDWYEMRLPNPYVLQGEFKCFQGQYYYYSKMLAEEEKILDLEDGAILESVSGVPIDKYIASLIDNRYLHYDFKADKPIVETLRIFTKGAKYITLRFKGIDEEYFSKRLRSYKYYPRSKRKETVKEEGNIKTEILHKDKTAYIKINSFASRYIETDNILLEDVFYKTRNFSYIFLDIRGNGGGNEEYYIKNILPYFIEEKNSVDFYLLFRHGKYIKPFLKDKGFKYFLKAGEIMFTEELPENLMLGEEYRKSFGFFINNTRSISGAKYTGFKGKIYILTDHHTYSAAETFTAFAKAAGIATIIGITTGGDGVNIDPCVAALKNSGLAIRFNMSMGLNPNGSINEEVHTTPDIYVEQSFQDFLEGRDTLYEYIKGL